MRAAEACVAARIRRSSEADLVPRPRVRVERLQAVAHHGRPGARYVELVPGAAVEIGLREVVADRDPQLLVRKVEGRRAAPPRLLVEPARDQAPSLAVAGHVEVAPAVALPRVELLVDVREHGDARLRV